MTNRRSWPAPRTGWMGHPLPLSSVLAALFPGASPSPASRSRHRTRKKRAWKRGRCAAFSVHAWHREVVLLKFHGEWLPSLQKGGTINWPQLNASRRLVFMHVVATCACYHAPGFPHRFKFLRSGSSTKRKKLGVPVGLVACIGGVTVGAPSRKYGSAPQL